MCMTCYSEEIPVRMGNKRALLIKKLISVSDQWNFIVGKRDDQRRNVFNTDHFNKQTFAACCLSVRSGFLVGRKILRLRCFAKVKE